MLTLAPFLLSSAAEDQSKAALVTSFGGLGNPFGEVR